MHVCVHVVQGAGLRRYDGNKNGKKDYFKASLPKGQKDEDGKTSKTFTFCDTTGKPRTRDQARAEGQLWLACQGIHIEEDEAEEAAPNEGE